jgi:uncharacterized RDD family membrane protein YckC
MPRQIRSDVGRGVQGLRAGFVSQALAMAVNLGVGFLIYLGILAGVGFVRFLFGHAFNLPQPGPFLNADLASVTNLVLLWYCWSTTGRGPGEAFFGLRVVTKRGNRLSPSRGFVRALATVLTVGLGVIVALFSRRNKSLYDMIAGTSVIYAWRPAYGEPARGQRKSPDAAAVG